MGNVIYKVVFSGEIEPTAAIEEVKGKLAATFKMSPEQIEQLFTGDRKSVKKSPDLQLCRDIQEYFRQAGAVCAIEEIGIKEEIGIEEEGAIKEDEPDPPSSQTVEADDTQENQDNQVQPQFSVSQPPADDNQLACSGCGKMFASDDLIEYEGARICADCKPAFMQRLQEGAPVSTGALSGEYGSIENGVAGRYDFSISTVVSEAWSLVKGTKATVNGGLVIMYAIVIGIMMILGVISAILVPLLVGSTPSGTPPDAAVRITAIIMQIVSQVIVMAISYPFTAALLVIGIRRSVGLPIPFSMVFSCFNRIFSLLALNIVMMALIMLGFVLLILPGIYLSVCYIMAMPLMVEKNLSIWQALETSRKAVSKKWFKIFGLLIVLGLTGLVSVIPLGIPLIWTIPLGFIAIGILYREMFGVEEAA